MLTSLITANSQSVWKSFQQMTNVYYDMEAAETGIGLIGTNFTLRVSQDYSLDGDLQVWCGTVENYTAGQNLTLYAILSASVNTGTKTFEASLAAVTSGDGQSILTKAFGTAVSSGALSPNSTVNGPYLATFVFDSAAKLDNLENGDFFALKIAQSASSGTSGTVNILGLNLVCS